MKNKHVISIFTLVELLSVITVIVILISLLLPVLSKVKDKGRAINCISNERQLTCCWTQYADDWNGWVMPVYDGSNCWGAKMAPYINATKVSDTPKTKPILHCPSDSDWHSYCTGATGSSYTMNRYLGHLSYSYPICRIDKTIKKVIFFDSNGYYEGKAGVVIYRHGKGTNASWGDGSASWQSVNIQNPIYWQMP